MEIKLGIRDLNRELTLEVDQPNQAVEEAVRQAFAADDAVLSLTDTKGSTVLVPGRTLAYVEIGEERQRTVGFGTL